MELYSLAEQLQWEVRWWAHPDVQDMRFVYNKMGGQWTKTRVLSRQQIYKSTYANAGGQVLLEQDPTENPHKGIICTRAPDMAPA